MKKQNNTAVIFLAVFGILILILDSKAAIEGASQGIELCLRTVLPSLFPFFYLSGIINKHLTGTSAKLLRPLGKICGTPEGSEPLLLIGWLGGYPVGVQIVSDAYKNGNITKTDAERMLGFCSQPGPAFIFAVIGNLFQNMQAALALWIIIILSAFATAFLLPGKSKNQCKIILHNHSDPFMTAVKSIACVCGWVILFRIIIVMLMRWLLWMMPGTLTVTLTGILELTNGCVSLPLISNQVLRMVIGSFMLAFGGLCVGFQTKSVAYPLCCRNYFKGKIMQAFIASVMTYFYMIFFRPVL